MVTMAWQLSAGRVASAPLLFYYECYYFFSVFVLDGYPHTLPYPTPRSQKPQALPSPVLEGKPHFLLPGSKNVH